MAITNNGILNALPKSQLPDGYTLPEVTTFDDPEYQRTITLSVARATVENADAATTMANIINDATIGIKKQVTDILTADFSDTATVKAYGKLVRLGNNMQDMSGNAAALTDAATAYTAVVILYAKTV